MQLIIEDIDLIEISAIFTNSLQLEIAEILRDKDITQNLVGFFKSETHLHTHRVSLFSCLIGKKMGLSENLCNKIKEVAPLHDIGKLYIPTEILSKPSSLTKDEFEIIKKHSEYGHKILSASNNKTLKLGAIVALQHHEKWNGTGYPQKLRGQQIHLFARIIAAADVLDSLISDRVYKKGWAIKDVYDFFKAQQGVQFDPVIVELILKNFDEFFYLCKINDGGGKNV